MLNITASLSLQKQILPCKRYKSNFDYIPQTQSTVKQKRDETMFCSYDSKLIDESEIQMSNQYQEGLKG